MSSLPWWKTRVIYQIYPRSFQDTTGSGVGDLNGISQHLEYLKDLGIGAVWISPFFASPQVDCGYDVSDYCAVDPMFGSMDDFKAMLEKAHKLDIKIILDLVLNHTSDKHPWFMEARKSRDNPKHDWYIWHEGKKAPNNWLCGFTLKNAWVYNEATNECYLGQFTPGQPEVNWRNQDLRAEMYKVLRFWLDMGVDGFRLDVSNYYVKDSQLRSNPYGFTRPQYYFMRHLYNRDQPETAEICQEMRKICDSYPGDRMMMGEVFMDQASSVVRLQGKYDGLHTAYNFDSMYAKFTVPEFRKAFSERVEALEAVDPRNWANFSLSNHDLPRAATRFVEKDPALQLRKVKLLAAMLLLIKGTPTIYQGEELGMLDSEIPKELRVDPIAFARWPLALFYRDGCRTPMEWSQAAPNKGFSTASKTWLPVGNNTAVDTQEKDENSCLAFYKKLLALRNETPALQSGDIWFAPNTTTILGFKRTLGDAVYKVMLNFGEEVSTTLEGEPILASAAEVEQRGQTMITRLGKYGVLVYK